MADPTPTPTTTPNDPNAPSDAPPAYTGSQQAVQSPIGVPYYITDPNTGQPMQGPDGQPLRWGASVPVPPNGPGSRGIEGPGTAPSSGFDYQLPRYFSGDEWLPAQLPPDQLAALQRKMVAAGLLKPGTAQLGVWDQVSMTAYTRLLEFANASGLDAQTALDRWGQATQKNPNQGRAPLVVQVTNPDDLRQTFRKAVIDTLGEGWDQSKIDQMVNAYQQVETQAQQQQYQMKGTTIDPNTGYPVDAGQGGTVTAPPSPQAYAEQQARSEAPAQAQEHDSLGFINQFRQMVGGWQG